MPGIGHACSWVWVRGREGCHRPGRRGHSEGCARRRGTDCYWSGPRAGVSFLSVSCLLVFVLLKNPLFPRAPGGAVLCHLVSLVRLCFHKAKSQTPRDRLLWAVMRRAPPVGCRAPAPCGPPCCSFGPTPWAADDCEFAVYVKVVHAAWGPLWPQQSGSPSRRPRPHCVGHSDPRLMVTVVLLSLPP